MAVLTIWLESFPALGEDFTPGCTSGIGHGAELQDAINTANTTPELDQIFLNPVCTYPITATLNITSDIAIYGNGATISGDNSVRVFFIDAGGNLTLNELRITGGSSTLGGGILNEYGTVTLNNSTVSNNRATLYDGGGIYNFRGTVTLNNSTVSNNSAGGAGGGINNDGGTMTLNNSTVSNNSAQTAGGIMNFDTMTLNNSTVSNNLANNGGGIYNSRGNLTAISSTISNNTAVDTGGGIRTYDFATTILTNSTIAGNSAGGDGGGIHNEGSNLHLNNSTIAGNSAGGDGGAIYVVRFGVQALNTIIYDNGPQECVPANIGHVAPGMGCGGSVSGTGVLDTFNGSYFPLLPGSPAIDAGDDDFCPENDQRDAPRPQDGDGDGTANCDLGAYEADTVVIPVPLAASAECVGNDLVVTISAGNGPFDVSGSGAGLPLVGVGIGTYSLTGPGTWNGVTVTEIGGDEETLTLGDFEYALPPEETPEATETPAETPEVTETPSETPEATETPAETPEATETPAPTVPAPTATAPPPPPAPHAEDLNFDASGVVRTGIPDTMVDNINIRILYQNGSPTQWLGNDLYNPGSIGIQGVLNLGVQQAVDIFSPVGRTYFEGGAVFCLRGTGTLIWMAASNQPRVAEIIGSYTVDEFPGFTCATLFEPGTLVLVSDNPFD